MFIGEFEHILDNKRRLAIPYRFRRALGRGAIITRGLEQNLVVYPLTEWEKLANKLASLPSFDKSVREFQRLVFSGAAEVDFDRSGRVLIPGFLVLYASLKSQAMVVGLYNRIEIWDKAIWQKVKKSSDEQEIMKRLSQLGL